MYFTHCVQCKANEYEALNPANSYLLLNLPQVALETVSANIQFVESYSDTIKEWLEGNTDDVDNGGGGDGGQGSGAAGNFRCPGINVAAAAAAVLPAVIGRAMRS